MNKIRTYCTKQGYLHINTMIRSVVRLALKLGFSYQKFNELLKFHYMNECTEYLRENGLRKANSPSVIASMTGLTRQSIYQLRKKNPLKGMDIYSSSRYAMVIKLWLKNYSDENGPRPLEKEEMIDLINLTIKDSSYVHIVQILIDSKIMEHIKGKFYLKGHEVFLKNDEKLFQAEKKIITFWKHECLDEQGEPKRLEFDQVIDLIKRYAEGSSAYQVLNDFVYYGIIENSNGCFGLNEDANFYPYFVDEIDLRLDEISKDFQVRINETV